MSKLMRTEVLVLGALMVFGAGNAIAYLIRGDYGPALLTVGLVVLIAVFLLLAGRSERLRRRLFETDERLSAINLFAATWAGLAVMLVAFSIYLVEIARGHSGEPYYWLSGIYVLLFAFLALGRTIRQ